MTDSKDETAVVTVPIKDLPEGTIIQIPPSKTHFVIKDGSFPFRPDNTVMVGIPGPMSPPIYIGDWAEVVIVKAVAARSNPIQLHPVINTISVTRFRADRGHDFIGQFKREASGPDERRDFGQLLNAKFGLFWSDFRTDRRYFVTDVAHVSQKSLLLVTLHANYTSAKEVPISTLSVGTIFQFGHSEDLWEVTAIRDRVGREHPVDIKNLGTDDVCAGVNGAVLTGRVVFFDKSASLDPHVPPCSTT